MQIYSPNTPITFRYPNSQKLDQLKYIVIIHILWSWFSKASLFFFFFFFFETVIQTKHAPQTTDHVTKPRLLRSPWKIRYHLYGLADEFPGRTSLCCSELGWGRDRKCGGSKEDSWWTCLADVPPRRDVFFSSSLRRGSRRRWKANMHFAQYKWHEVIRRIIPQKVPNLNRHWNECDAGWWRPVSYNFNISEISRQVRC